jgi:hypothetical protein
LASHAGEPVSEEDPMPYGIVFMTEVLPTLIWTAGGLAALWLGSNVFLKYRRNPPGDELGRIADSLELLHQSIATFASCRDA